MSPTIATIMIPETKHPPSPYFQTTRIDIKSLMGATQDLKQYSEHNYKPCIEHSSSLNKDERNIS